MDDLTAVALNGFEDERWCPVVGFEGLYEVSDHGRVRSLSRKVPRGDGWITIKARFLTPQSNVWSGKPGLVRATTVALSKNNKSQAYSIGPLVLRAFVGPAPANMECCHGDGRNSNNHLSNLRWDTHKENMADVKRYGGSVAPRTPLRGEKSANALLTEEAVRIIRSEPKAPNVCHMLAKRFGVGYHAIWKVRSGDNWRHVE